MLTSAIGYLCEAAYHHADLAITWGKLWVKLKTHSAGGITDKDFEVAKKIEDVVLWRPVGGPLGAGNPNKFVFSKSCPPPHHEARSPRSALVRRRRLGRRQAGLRLE